MAVYRDLPDSLLRPCEEPAWSPAEVRTDVDLMGLLSRYRLASTCNAAKLKAIERIYRAEDKPPLG